MTKKKDELIKQANNTLKNTTDSPMTITEFIGEIIENPNIARNAHQYLLDAIEYYGTREIFEGGEQKERYRFFDDPANNGEHAVLGNTDVLNEFVTDLRVIVNSEERMQKIILFNGPTATGKSELKRCLVNGIREYSKTEEGKRYTFDWNISSMNSSDTGLTYGEKNINKIDESEWFKSPIQSNPLSVLPYDVRKEIKESSNIDIPIDIDLDPFSQEAYDILKTHYEQNGTEELFTNITNKNHFRIRRYTVDETQSIGILNAEDDGSIKERLIGAWMPSMFQVLDSRGRKNPQAFSYDGVLSQGNNGLTIIEDATRHADILMHLLNIPDEGHAKIDKKIGFDVDTVPIFISNPDLMKQQIDKDIPAQQRGELGLHEIHGLDPMKAIKRRLFKYDIKYLTNLTDESKLIRKEMIGHNAIYNSEKPIQIRDSLINNGIEFAPHVIEAVALYNIITRYVEPENIENVNLVDKALLLDRGYIETNQGRINIDEYEEDIKLTDKDGTFGIPVTYTRDILQSLLYDTKSDVYLPEDVLNIITERFTHAPIFNEQEISSFNEKIEPVKKYIQKQQEKDIINAILYNRKASEESINKYIENIYDWHEDTNKEYDELFLKEFEKKHFGTKETEYGGNVPGDEVLELRENKIIKPLNKYLWKQRNAGYEIDEISLSDSPVISSLIGSYDWEDVFIEYNNLDPYNWDNPSDNTSTKEIKQNCVDILVDEFGYTRKSATKTSNVIFKENIDEIQNIKSKIV